MAIYKVIYEHEVVITYEALVEADSEEEAFGKIEGFEFISEEEVGYQGIDVKPQYAVLIEEEVK